MRVHPFLHGLTPTLHIAHRGGAALAPENTLLAFRRAIEHHRTDMIELDVHLTRDGELVVSHDPTLDRCTDGAGPIADTSLAEIERLDAGYRFTPDGGRTFPFRGQGIRVPTLREVLEAFPRMRFNIEVKEDTPDVEHALARVLERTGAIERTCCGSASDALAARISDALPNTCLFYPQDALAAFVITARSGEEPSEDPRFLVLDMPLTFEGIRLIDPNLLAAASRHGKWVNVWTVDDPTEMERLVDEGVGGIMTDRPDLLRSVLDARR